MAEPSSLTRWKLACFVDATETPDAQDFRRRVQQLINDAATAIAGEDQVYDAGPPVQAYTPEQWRKRGDLAASVLATHIDPDTGKAISGSEVWLDTFAFAVTTNLTITAASDDNDILFTINSVWDDIAGVTGKDLL